MLFGVRYDGALHTIIIIVCESYANCLIITITILITLFHAQNVRTALIPISNNLFKGADQEIRKFGISENSRRTVFETVFSMNNIFGASGPISSRSDIICKLFEILNKIPDFDHFVIESKCWATNFGRWIKSSRSSDWGNEDKKIVFSYWAELDQRLLSRNRFEWTFHFTGFRNTFEIAPFLAPNFVEQCNCHRWKNTFYVVFRKHTVRCVRYEKCVNLNMNR